MKLIISLGGSLIAPGKIDTAFLKNFKKVVVNSAKSNSFVIIPGGGAMARIYQKTARQVAPVSDADLDRIGIATNMLHTYLLRAIFRKSKNIIVEKGGLQPGGTSDSTSVKFASRLRVKTVVNLTNVDGVFDHDPRRYKKAKLIRKMTWRDLRKQFGTGKKPGRHLPFDASVAPEAEKLGLKVVILNGRNFKNFYRFLVGNKFRGTIIES